MLLLSRLTTTSPVWLQWTGKDPLGPPSPIAAEAFPAAIVPMGCGFSGLLTATVSGSNHAFTGV